MNKSIKYGLIVIVVFALGLVAGRLLLNPKKSEYRLNGTSSQVEEHEDHLAEEETIWTCSMHPQIRQPEPGQCPICGMDLIPLETASAQGPTALTMTTEAIRLANIQTQTVGEPTTGKEAAESWLINGKILPDERQVYSQVPHIAGRIEALAVTYEGMYVKKGSKIADIYAPEIISAQREFLEAQKLADINPNLLEAARNKLKFLKIPDSFIEKLENTGEVVESFPLLAGKSGYVLNKKVEIGDYVASGQVLFDIYDLSSVWAVFDVYEKDISRIKMGDVIEFSAMAVPDKTFKTRIDFINPLLDPETRAIRIRGQVTNRGGILKPQMLIRGSLLTKHKSGQDQLMIPKTAVLWTGRESVVYVQDTTMNIPTFVFREVTLGPEIGSQYRILDGLTEGEKVVTNGVFAVDASAQLNNQRSMMNRMVETPGHEDHFDMIHPVDPDVVTDGAEKDLDRVLNTYIQLKNDLVTGEPDQIQLALENMNKVAESLADRDDLGTYNAAWNGHLNNFRHHLKLMTEESEIKGWREAFVPLSTVLIRWIREFGNPGEEMVYVQHCPMANNDQGADWLSMDLNIRNPYYGEQMLTCGTTLDTLVHP